MQGKHFISWTISLALYISNIITLKLDENGFHNDWSLLERENFIIIEVY